MSYETITVEPGPAPSRPVPTGTNGMAVASFVLGLLWLGGLGSFLAIIFGVMGRRQTSETGQAGKGLASWGLGLGIAGLLIMVLWFVVVVLAVGGTATALESYSQCVDAAQTAAEMEAC
jgi:hypothetical protein